jgi:RNA polymerase sigma factor (sigma-70 family)
MDDFELLQAYASQRNEDAFGALTGRYIDLVYSAAVRQTGSPQTAEDVTQAVFLTLARKAGSISRHAVLSGWLLRTTRFAAANARRLEQRRQHHEQQAVQSHVCPTGNEAAWQRIAPLLDEALEYLGEKDRDAIALRFLERKSLKQVAEKLGVSEDGAQKRVTRAIEKLRAFFTRHGKSVSVAALTGTLASSSVQAAPVALAVSISAAVTSQGALTGSAVAALAKATAEALARAKLQVFAVRAVSMAVLLGLASVPFIRIIRPSAESNVSIATTPASPPITAETQQLPIDQASPQLAAAATFPPGNFRALLLRVVDAQSGAPVTNARLTLVSATVSPSRVTNIFLTDIQGSSRLSYAAEPLKSWSHQIEIFRDGYVPKFLRWSEYQQDNIDEIPDEYTVKADPAVTIGGVVMDEQDVPIAGMKVVFSVSGPTASRARERLTMMGNYHTEITDVRGRWSCSHVPSRFGMIDYHLIHPEYQKTLYASDSPDSASYDNVERLAEADLLAGRAILRAKHGLVVAGVVADETGQPVAGAKITQGYDFRSPERTTQTTADGSFRFGNGRSRELTLTIQAAGLAPVVTSLVVNASMENLRFTLPPGQLLLGRVLDEAGQPVASATVEPASPSSDSRTLFEWRTKTGADGRFSWDAAPATQNYAIYASGYESQQRTTLTADGTEGVITLQKKNSPSSLRILGEVMDAETKMPPAGVRVQIWQTRKEPGGGWSSFTTRPEDVASDGRFRLKTSSGAIGYVLEAQADGYWPERLTNQVTGAAEVRLNIELKQAPLHGGVVFTPAGDSAGGATIVVCGPREWAQMNQPGKLHNGAHAVTAGTVSDAEGRFRLPQKYAPEFVVVAHAQGFTELPFSQFSSNTTVTLQPWGRIEGTFILAGQPRANETIALGGASWRFSADSSRLSLFLNTKTDANGRFVFETVPPGERRLDWRPGFRDGKVGMVPLSHGVPVAVKPGETAQVTLGGTGRPVVGKIVVAGRDKPVDWTHDVQSLALKHATPPEPVLPKPFDFPSYEEYTAAVERIGVQNKPFWTSEEGRALQRAQRTYVLLFDKDGSFRIDDVPPGTYSLRITLTEPTKTYSPLSQGTPIGTLESEVTVPEDSDDAAFDLGTLTITP